MTRRSFPTRNDLPADSREATVMLLNANLANAIDLALQSKQAHWNVRGPHFRQLHELFDETYAAASEWVDLLAERAVQLGGVAEGTLAVVQGRSRLPAYDLDLVEGPQHLEALASSLGAFARLVREAIRGAEKNGDAGTADLFTEVSRGADEKLWMVEAHLQAER